MKTNNKILFLMLQDALPATDGGKIGIFYPIKYFAKYCEVYMALPVEKLTDEILEKYAKYNITAIPYQFSTKDSPYYYFKSLFSNMSFKMTKYYNQKFYDKIEKFVKDNSIEHVWAGGAHMAKYAIKLKKKYPHIKIYLREHNIEYKILKQYCENMKNIIVKIFAYIEYFKTKKYEQNLWNKFDKVFFISDTDYQEAKSHKFNLENSTMIYDGMELNQEEYITCVEENSFISTGNLSSFQNKVNLQYFIGEIWKAFVKKYPEAKLYLTGNKDETVYKVLKMTKKECEQYNIINLGFVDNIQKTIAQKQFVISPTMAGAGIRLKVLEACALNKIVFVSRIDYDMCKHFKDMDNIVLFENELDFTNKYEKLINDKNLQSRIQQNAGKIAEQVFSWESYVQKAMEYMGIK